jgi:hypothetical protein
MVFLPDIVGGHRGRGWGGWWWFRFKRRIDPEDFFIPRFELSQKTPTYGKTRLNGSQGFDPKEGILLRLSSQPQIQATSYGRYGQTPRPHWAKRQRAYSVIPLLSVYISKSIPNLRHLRTYVSPDSRISLLSCHFLLFLLFPSYCSVYLWTLALR